MPINIERYNKLRQEVETAEAEANRAEGALGTLMQRLAQEYECKTIKEAERLLTDLEAEAEEAEATYNKALKEFEDDWSTKIQTAGGQAPEPA